MDSLVISSMKTEYRHTDYPSGSEHTSIMMLMPEHGNAEVEYVFDASFQVR